MVQNGIHHITAIAGPAQQNLDFYARTLGLRLVKKTVNFDDPGTYHLYYGDEAGQPGTIGLVLVCARGGRRRPAQENVRAATGHPQCRAPCTDDGSLRSASSSSRPPARTRRG